MGTSISGIRDSDSNTDSSIEFSSLAGSVSASNKASQRQEACSKRTKIFLIGIVALTALAAIGGTLAYHFSRTSSSNPQLQDPVIQRFLQIHKAVCRDYPTQTDYSKISSCGFKTTHLNQTTMVICRSPYDGEGQSDADATTRQHVYIKYPNGEELIECPAGAEIWRGRFDDRGWLKEGGLLWYPRIRLKNAEAIIDDGGIQLQNGEIAVSGLTKCAGNWTQYTKEGLPITTPLVKELFQNVKDVKAKGDMSGRTYILERNQIINSGNHNLTSNDFPWQIVCYKSPGYWACPT